MVAVVLFLGGLSFSVQCRDRAADAVQNVAPQQHRRVRDHVGVLRGHDERGEIVRHVFSGRLGLRPSHSPNSGVALATIKEPA